MLNMWWRIWETGTWADTGWHRIKSGFKLFRENYPQCSSLQNYFPWMQIRRQKFQSVLCLFKMLNTNLDLRCNRTIIMSKSYLIIRLYYLAAEKKVLVHLDLDLGSVIFPHQFDSPVHHVSVFISVSSPVPVSWHFPLTACFSAFRPVFPPSHKPWRCFPAGF